MTFSNAPNFDGLADLGRKDGVDIRPVLVRVLTDLYVQKPYHTGEEEQNYVELMLRFIGATDVATRAIVARKLAAYDRAPRAVIQRLARDVIEVAEPILRQSPLLSPADLVLIADCGPQHAAIVTARRHADISRSVEEARPVSSFASTPTVLADAEERALPAQAKTQPPPATAPEPVNAGMQREVRRSDDADLSRRFFKADSAGRRKLLAELEAETSAAAESEVRKHEDLLARLETSALRRMPEAFENELERALAISRDAASLIVHDERGEPLLVALKALGMPSAMVLRVLLFLNPAIGQSVERVFDLARLYDRISPAAASRLIASMQHSEALERRVPRHQPAYAPDPLTRVREAFASAPRRTGQQSTTGASSDNRKSVRE